MAAMRARLVAAAAVLALVASGTLGCAQPPASPAGTEAVQTLAQPAEAPQATTGGGACPASASAPNIGDIDGDGLPDTVVTVFYREAGRLSESGVLEIRNSAAGNQSIRLGDFTMLGIPSVVVGDITGDGCADIVGSYYYQSDGAGADLEEGIFVMHGSRDGLVPDSLTKYPGISGDIALLTKPKALVVSTGSRVKLYPLSAQGVPGKGKQILKVPTGSEGVGSIEALAASGNRLVLGIQSRQIGRKYSAGMVFVLTFSGTGMKYHKLTLTQATRGFSTAVEFSDRFGSAVAMRGNLVAITAPGETIGKAKSTGIVHVVKLTSGNKPRIKTVYNLHRNSPGIPGTNLSDDAWGYSVNLAAGIGCTNVSVLVGAPFKAVAGIDRAGVVTVAGLGRPCGASWSRADAPFTGVATTQGFGTEIGVVAGTAGGPDTVLLNTGGGYQYSQAFQVTDDPAGTWKVTELLPMNGKEPPMIEVGSALRK